ncbi:RHS repeat-associated core domain-containing protein, partial [Akkermansia sp.]
YDESNHMIALTTFRVDEKDITTDPTSRTDGDTTTWLYDTATGLELKKTYADGSCVSKTYDRLNRLETLTKARGIITSYTYAPFTGELVSVTHSDSTPEWDFAYNHLGQMVSVCDISGTREISYDVYGRMIQETSFGTAESCIQEEYDAFGRSCGYRLMIGTRTVQYSSLDYDHKGDMMSMNMEGLGTPFTWEYDETSGFLNKLSYPNGMVRRNTYHPRINLLASIGYEDAGTGDMLAGHVYQYDHLMRPIQRRDSWDTSTMATTRDFTYNSRSELVNDELQQRGNFAYQYDNIGNRKIVRELEEETSYGTNRLNQYTNIIQADASFDPVYDADGNQIRIKTSTGIWNVCYDGNDRPVSFTSEDGRTVVSCGYDYQGRRFEKKVLVNGTTISHAYYLYRGYLQVAELDLMHPQPVLVKDYVWDPTETIATRLLMMTCWKEKGIEVKENLYFMHDALKNVTCVFGEQHERKARYEYSPFGGMLTAEGDVVHTNKFRFSCEYTDDELGLVYYNYRHLNPTDGRWINRDPIQEQGGQHLYGFLGNNSLINIEITGKIFFGKDVVINATPDLKSKSDAERTIKEYTFKGIINEIDDEVNCFCCIENLTLIMHGNPGEMVIVPKPGETIIWNNSTDPKKANRIYEGNVTEMVKALKNEETFCSKCFIYLVSCEVGLGVLPQKIANESKCTVYAPNGYAAIGEDDNPLHSKVFTKKITKIINGKSVNIGDPTSLLPQGIGSELSFSEFKPQS